MSIRAFGGLKSLALSISACLLTTVSAHAETDTRMILNWKYQGPQGLLFLAEDNGYFDEEDLNVTMDQQRVLWLPMGRMTSASVM